MPKRALDIIDMFPACPKEMKSVTFGFGVISPDRLRAALERTPILDLNRKEVREESDVFRDICVIPGIGMNCESMVFASDGSITDGRRRAFACVDLNVPYVGYIVTGVAPEAVYATDMRLSRKNLVNLTTFTPPLAPLPDEAPDDFASRMNRDGPYGQIISMSPDRARHYFSPEMDRTLTPREINASNCMARDVRARRWVLTGQTIKVGKDSKKIIDGRLFCRAVRIADVEAPCIIVHDVPESYAVTFNAGRESSLGHRLHASRTAMQAYAIASALELLYRYKARNPQAVPTQTELYQLWLDNPDITDCVKPARDCSEIVRMSVCVAMLQIFRSISLEFASKFVERLLDLKSDDMFGRLRKAIHDNGGTKHGGARAELNHARWMILTWNCFVQGRTNLRLRNSEDWPSKVLRPD